MSTTPLPAGLDPRDNLYHLPKFQRDEDGFYRISNPAELLLNLTITIRDELAVWIRGEEQWKHEFRQKPMPSEKWRVKISLDGLTTHSIAGHPTLQNAMDWARLEYAELMRPTIKLIRPAIKMPKPYKP